MTTKFIITMPYINTVFELPKSVVRDYYIAHNVGRNHWYDDNYPDDEMLWDCLTGDMQWSDIENHVIMVRPPEPAYAEFFDDYGVSVEMD